MPTRMPSESQWKDLVRRVSPIKTFYGTCTTDATNRNKVVDCPEFKVSDFTIGAHIIITMGTAQKAEGQVTFNINNTGPQKFYLYQDTENSVDAWAEGNTINCVFDGMAWNRVGVGISQGEVDAKVGEVDSKIDEVDQRLTEEKQDKLVSGENLKTVGGEDLLGEGNVEVPKLYDTLGTNEDGALTQKRATEAIQGLTTAIEGVDEKVESLGDQVEQMEQKFDGEIKSLQDKDKLLEQGLDALETLVEDDVKSLQSKDEEHDQKIEELEGKIGTSDGKIKELQEAQTQTETDIENLQETQKATDQEVENLKKGQTTTDAKLKELEAKDKTLEEGLDALETLVENDVKSLEAKDAEIEGKIEEIEGKQSTMDGDITKLKGYADKTVQFDTTIADDKTTTVTLIKKTGKLNATSATETNLPLPVASSTQAGVMNPSTYNSVQQTAEKVNNLMSGAVAVSGIAAEPSQSDLTSKWKTASGKTDLVNGAKMLDITNGRTWTYYSNTQTWYSQDNENPEITFDTFTNTEEGLIKGKDADGYVFAESDGTGSVKGWDALKADVAIHKSEINGLKEEVEGLGSDKQDKLVSGTNIKTVNNTSLLGSGNVAVQPVLVSGTNIKSINGTSLLGSGDYTFNTVTTFTDEEWNAIFA